MKFKIRRRKSYRFLGGLVTFNTSNFRLTSITNRFGFLSRNSRKPGRLNVDLPGAFRGELDYRKDEDDG